MFRLFIICAILFSLSSCATQEQTADKANLPATDSTTNTKAETTVTGPINSTLNAYYQVKDAFVRTDGTGVDMAAMQLRLSVDSLNAQKLEMDSSFNTTITNSKKSILSAIDGIIKEREMEKKRMQFAVLSDNLYSLIKATPYKGETVYQVHCPMAFDKGANWLNNQPVVANPYFGSKMMECGEVTDSLTGR